MTWILRLCKRTLKMVGDTKEKSKSQNQYIIPYLMRVSVVALGVASAFGLSEAFNAPAPIALRRSANAAPSMGLRRARVAGLKMATILDNGEMALSDEECEKLKMPPNTVVPVDNVEQFKGMLQEIDDEAIRRLARQIGTNPAEEPYPGYYDDVKRLGLEGKDLTASKKNPGGMYGPDGKAYAPWMVGKVNEDYTKKAPKVMSEDEKKFNFASRGQELSGVGLTASLLGDEVRLAWDVEGEVDSKGYIVTKRPGGSEDGAYFLVADYQTPGAFLESGRLGGKYSYVDGNVDPGVWVYRVQEENVNGEKSALSQTIIDIPSNEDKIKTLVAASFLGITLTVLTVLSVIADPQNGIVPK